MKARRRELGMTAARLASLAGVTENAIRKLESGDSSEPRFSTGMHIADALQLPPSELAGGGAGRSSGGAPELARVIALIRSIREDLESEGVEHVDVFGSVARGDAEPGSDVDVFVTPRPGARFSLFNLSGAGYLLEKALGGRVDALTRRMLENSERMQPALAEAVRAF